MLLSLLIQDIEGGERIWSACDLDCDPLCCHAASWLDTALPMPGTIRVLMSSVACAALKGQQGSSSDATFLIQDIEGGERIWSACDLNCDPLCCQALGQSVWQSLYGLSTPNYHDVCSRQGSQLHSKFVHQVLECSEGISQHCNL